MWPLVVNGRLRGAPLLELAFLALALSSGLVQAEVFVLSQGGRIRGQWLNRDKDSLEPYEIALDHGARLTLDAWQVQRVLAPETEPAEASPDYQRRLAETADTVEGHWELAEWCRQENLGDQRRLHLQRILELDPHHAAARYGLGYHQFRGRWVRRQDFLESRGYVRHDGRWRLPQEIQLQDERKRIEQAEKDWRIQLRRWRAALASGDARDAYQGLATLDDPLAVPALRGLLHEEWSRQVKLMYVAALGRIGGPAAAGTLVETSLNDPDEEVFHECIAQLVRTRPPHITQSYVEALRDNNNIKVNRAAYALARLGDRSCLSPLIDALTTTHYLVLPGRGNMHTASFISPAGPEQAAPLGGTGLSAGDQTSVIPWTVNNDQVLQALIRLAGVNFSFDQSVWRYWLANENRRQPPVIEPRRDVQPPATPPST
jgi:HEAT repeat protein